MHYRRLFIAFLATLYVVAFPAPASSVSGYEDPTWDKAYDSYGNLFMCPQDAEDAVSVCNSDSGWGENFWGSDVLANCCGIIEATVQQIKDSGIPLWEPYVNSTAAKIFCKCGALSDTSALCIWWDKYQYDIENSITGLQLSLPPPADCQSDIVPTEETIVDGPTGKSRRKNPAELLTRLGWDGDLIGNRQAIYDLLERYGWSMAEVEGAFYDLVEEMLLLLDDKRISEAFFDKITFYLGVHGFKDEIAYYDIGGGELAEAAVYAMFEAVYMQGLEDLLSNVENKFRLYAKDPPEKAQTEWGVYDAGGYYDEDIDKWVYTGEDYIGIPLPFAIIALSPNLVEIVGYEDALELRVWLGISVAHEVFHYTFQHMALRGLFAEPVLTHMYYYAGGNYDFQHDVVYPLERDLLPHITRLQEESLKEAGI